MSKIEVRGLDELVRDFGEARIEQAIATASLTVANEIANELKTYPPATAANRPGRWTTNVRGYPRPLGYYERNRGWWYPIMTERALYARGRLGKARGTIKAPTRIRSIAGYRLRAVSEMLGKRWSVERYGRSGARVSNSATYAPYVQSAQHQSVLMAKIGWVTDEQAVRYVLGQNIFERALGQLLARSGRL